MVEYEVDFSMSPKCCPVVLVCTISSILLTLTFCKQSKDTFSDLSVAGGGACGAGPVSVTKPGQVPTREMIVQTAKVLPEEIAAINHYTHDTTGAGFIKHALQCAKKGDYSDFCFFEINYPKLSQVFESGIKKISETIPFVGTVYRGITVSRKAADTIKGQVGKVIGLGFNGDAAYTSASRSLEFAQSWARKLNDSAKAQALGGSTIDTLELILAIQQCRGASIEAIEPAARAAAQKEVILPPSKYRFTSARMAEGRLVLEAVEAGCKDFGLVEDLGIDGQLIASIGDHSIASPKDLQETVTWLGQGTSGSLSLDRLNASIDPEILAVFEPSRKGPQQGFGLVDTCVGGADENARKASYDQVKKLNAYKKWLGNLQEKINTVSDLAEKNRLVQNYQKVQAQANAVLDEFSTAMKYLKFGAKITAVAGAAAQVVGWALGIAEAVDIKKTCTTGDCDAKAAAAVLSGMGIAGAIPAVLACDNCSPQQKAAAFFKGFFGIDFAAQAKCAPGFEAVGGYICRKTGCEPGYTDLAATCHRPAKIIPSLFTGADCRGDICGLTTGRGCRACPKDDGTPWHFDGCTCRRDPVSYSKQTYGSKP
jgi:hypothetical protein